MKYLIIVESPSKCKKIEKYLKELYPSHDFIVKASVGHVMKLALSGVGRMGIDFKNNYNPDFVIDTKKKKVVSDIKKCLKYVDKVLIATDLDYEGAKIGYDIAKILKMNFDEKNRIIFNEITKNALKNAFENPQKIDMNMVHSQFARRVLDRIIGFKLSKITAKQFQKGASAGRVLSATTQIIYDNEKKIDENIEDFHYDIYANFINPKYTINETLYNKTFNDLKKLKKIFDKFKKSNFLISNIIEKNELTNPSKPFITSTINQSSPYSVKKTSMILQKLYQKGLITYIRTDSHKMSDDAKNMIKKYIIDNYGNDYFQYRVFDSKKVKGSQEAHECIRPTNINKNPHDLKVPEEKKIYKLIWERSVECLMSPAKYNSKTLDIKVSNTKIIFKKKINYYYFLGYKIIYDTLDNLNKDVHFFDKIKNNDELKYLKIYTDKKFKSSGKRYNESKLVKQLESLGIGRPSTYSKTIDNIQDKYYVEKKNINGKIVDVVNLLLKDNNITEINQKQEINGEKNKLVITKLGTEVTEFLQENFPLIMNYDFTSNVESDLDSISSNEKIWYNVVDNYYKKLLPNIEKMEKELKNVKKDKKDNNLIGEYKNKNFYTFISRWGPRIVYGEIGNKDTLYLNPNTNISLNEHKIEDCIKLLPKIKGKYQKKDIILLKSKTLYFKWNNKNIPLNWNIKNKQKNEITFEDAISSIEKYLEKK